MLPQLLEKEANNQNQCEKERISKKWIKHKRLIVPNFYSKKKPVEKHKYSRNFLTQLPSPRGFSNKRFSHSGINKEVITLI